MLDRINLAGSDWVLSGYLGLRWRLPDIKKHSYDGARGYSKHIDAAGIAMCGPVPAMVPGSVHADLLRAGLIEQWNEGLNSYKSEWVENRQWVYERTFSVPEDWRGKNIILKFSGLDYAGTVYIDENPAAEFASTYLPLCVNLNGRVCPGREHRLSVEFYPAPQQQAQISYTSRLEFFKPRYNYSWDWIERVVNTGIWDDVELLCTGAAEFEQINVRASLQDDFLTGGLTIDGLVHNASRVDFVLTDSSNKTVCEQTVSCNVCRLQETFNLGAVQVWCPNGQGAQPLYCLKALLFDAQGEPSDKREWILCFKHIRWVPNENAPEGADSFCPEINGRKLFLRGVNWVPLSPFPGSVTEDEYRQVLSMYRDMNVNLIRIWGGGVLEKECCYRIAAEYGIMIWQEFPLSSAALDNVPPADHKTVDELCRIAENWIARRGHFGNLIIWCGGNELSYTSHLSGCIVPIDDRYPCIQRLKAVVNQFDPDKKFYPTSGLGPISYPLVENFGKGLHHNVHGPWYLMSSRNFYDFYNREDALFHGEVGVPAFANYEMIKKWSGSWSALPLTNTNPYIKHHSGYFWPIQKTLQEEFGVLDFESERGAGKAAKLSAFLQAEQYRYMAEACRRKAFHSSGILFWIGHDAFFCAIQLSIVEADRTVRPSFWTLQRACAPQHVSLQLEQSQLVPGAEAILPLFIHNDLEAGRFDVAASLRTVYGAKIASFQICAEVPANSTVSVGSLLFDGRDVPHGVLIVEMVMRGPDGFAERDCRWLTVGASDAPWQALRDMPTTSLELKFTGEQALEVHNTGSVTALGVCLKSEPLKPGEPLGWETVFPGESVIISHHSRGGRWSVDALNIAG